MSLYTFFGCLLLAYGPILSIFFLYIAPNAQYVLLMVSSVAIQEICRWGFYLLLNKAEAGLNTVSANPKSPFNRSVFAFVSGFGYALMSSLVGYISLLAESIGPGVMMCPSCPAATLYFISAITTSLFSLMHVFWMMISFDGFSELPRMKGWFKIGWVVISHYGASFATTLNSSATVNYGCVYSIVICLSIISVSVFIVASSLRSRYRLSLQKS
ncbi:gamma-secretase subunit Aph-1 [Parasitella parasitica]|nr:gamma-secretase subunit Aph-1 [Parasitella parasitica]